jgi:hypothetical protein
VARYRVSPPRLRRPGALRVARRGRAVRVRWARVAGARRYGVVVSPATGRQRVLKVRRRSLRLTGAVAARGGTVRVSALDALGHSGPARAGRWRPKTRQPTRFEPFRELRARRR